MPKKVMPKNNIENDPEWEEYVMMLWQRMKEKNPRTRYREALAAARKNADSLEKYAAVTSENGDLSSDESSTSEYLPSDSDEGSDESSYTEYSDDESDQISEDTEEPYADGDRYGIDTSSSDSDYSDHY